jgi:hypothetical protein
MATIRTCLAPLGDGRLAGDGRRGQRIWIGFVHAGMRRLGEHAACQLGAGLHCFSGCRPCLSQPLRLGGQGDGRRFVRLPLQQSGNRFVYILSAALFRVSL